MLLCLTSNAAPDATLPELAAACARRGLGGLELAGDQLQAQSPDVLFRSANEGVPPEGGPLAVCGLYLEALDSADLGAYVELAAHLDAPLVVSWSEIDHARLSEMANACARAGATLLIAHGSDPVFVPALLERIGSLPGTTGLAWNVRPSVDDPRQIEETLSLAAPQLRYVRLHGGGPEAEQQTGRGVGALMGRLALARYDGPLVVTPSDRRFHYIWRAWLGRSGGWGCGSKQSDPSLVNLGQGALLSGDRN